MLEPIRQSAPFKPLSDLSHVTCDVSEINILEAWKLWLSGGLSPNFMLWGISVFWWGRIGKIMQFSGAVTIIADIIGPEKIRQFGTSLQGTISSTTLIQFLKQCFSWYAVIFRQTVMKDYTNESNTTKSGDRHPQLDLLNYLICLFLTIFITISAKLYLTGWSLFVEVVLIFGGLLVSIAPIFTVLVIISLTLMGLTVNSIFIKPLAWILEHPSLDRYTKIASLWLLLVGFHFELLAS